MTCSNDSAEKGFFAIDFVGEVSLTDAWRTDSARIVYVYDVDARDE